MWGEVKVGRKVTGGGERLRREWGTIKGNGRGVRTVGGGVMGSAGRERGAEVVREGGSGGHMRKREEGKEEEGVAGGGR